MYEQLKSGNEQTEEIAGLSLEEEESTNGIDKDRIIHSIEEPVISFDEYVALFEDLKTLSIPGFSLNEEISFLSNGVRVIEPYLSFGRRQFLTLDGEMDSSKDHSTERVLYFDSGSKRLALSLIYTKTNLENDFLGSDWLVFTEKNQSNSFLISFHNLLILTTFLDDEEVDLEEINTTHRTILNQLNE